MLIGLEFFTLSWPEIDQINGSFPFSCLINFPVLFGFKFSSSGFTRVHLYSLFILFLCIGEGAGWYQTPLTDQR